MHRVAVILGSNIDKERNIVAAVGLLAATARVTAVSTVYESAAVDRPEQPSFFNAAVLLLTPNSPVELKDGLLATIESRLGRVRTEDKHAPRTIDLDIVLYDEAILEYTPADGFPRHIPDPDLRRYAHCAMPVSELLPQMGHPETGEPLAKLAERLMAQTVSGGRPMPRPDIDLQHALRGNPYRSRGNSTASAAGLAAASRTGTNSSDGK